jgi:hypothetical protein
MASKTTRNEQALGLAMAAFFLALAVLRDSINREEISLNQGRGILRAARHGLSLMSVSSASVGAVRVGKKASKMAADELKGQLDEAPPSRLH